MLALAALLALCACDEGPTRSPPPEKQPAPAAVAFAPPAGFVKLRLGLTPFSSEETMRRTHEKLAAYLSRQLSVPVEIAVGASYDDTVGRLANGEFDLVELSPFAYVEASKRVKLRCLVQTIADGSATASGYIFVRDDSPRHTLADLKGARFGFVDKRSTSGFLYPMKLLKEKGLDPEKDFASVEFFGNHEAVLLAVLEGRIDAGATYQGSFAQARRNRGIDPLSFRVIGKTSRTPRDMYCVTLGVPVEVGDAITNALLPLTGRDRGGREILGPLNVNGFQKADDAAYDEVRQAAAAVGQ